MKKNNFVVFWDWNGTIVDDVFIFVEILNVLLKEECLHSISVDEYKSSFCFPIKSFYKKIKLYKNPAQFKSINERFINLYLSRMFNPCLKTNIVSVLNFLYMKNIKQYILSAQNQKTLDLLVQHYSLNKYFSKVVGVENSFALGKEKQALKLKSDVCFNGEKIIIIGDTSLDVFVAKSLKAQCLLVGWGHYSLDRLLKHSLPVFSSPADLQKHIAS